MVTRKSRLEHIGQNKDLTRAREAQNKREIKFKAKKEAIVDAKEREKVKSENKVKKRERAKSMKKVGKREESAAEDNTDEKIQARPTAKILQVLVDTVVYSEVARLFYCLDLPGFSCSSGKEKATSSTRATLDNAKVSRAELKMLDQPSVTVSKKRQAKNGADEFRAEK